MLSELFNAKVYILAAIGAFGSILSSFYYVSLIKVLYFEEQGTHSQPLQPGVPAVLPALLSFALVAYPLFPGFVYEASGRFAVSFFTEFF